MPKNISPILSTKFPVVLCKTTLRPSQPPTGLFVALIQNELFSSFFAFCLFPFRFLFISIWGSFFFNFRFLLRFTFSYLIWHISSSCDCIHLFCLFHISPNFRSLLGLLSCSTASHISPAFDEISFNRALDVLSSAK